LTALEDAYTPSISFDRLTWDEAAKLCQLSLIQGYSCVLSLGEGGVDDG